MMKRLALLSLFASLSFTHADPQLTSWFTANSCQYARVYTNAANETAGTKSTTWTRTANGQTTAQTSPTYSDVNEINYSSNWIYIRSTGLASHVMGPWPDNFPSFPSNTAVIYRIPRTPTTPASKTGTDLGATGRMVNGVSMFDSRDAFSYSTANAADARPNTVFTGDGIWNRDGYHNEGPTFDPSLAHQAGNNYHYHAQPIGLRYQLGDHVDYNPTTNRYTESAAPVTQHSPIVAWAADGLPVYGPYGYSDPIDANSGVRRMVSGFTLRNGTNGTTNITVRQILPAWAARVQNRSAVLAAEQNGPPVNATYLLGHYIEDFDYRGDLAGQTLGVNFDLNEQNVRYCVTPEFPGKTWAYFTTINADGTPQFPYTTGRQYYGSPTGGSRTLAEMNADTPLTRHFIGGANTPITISTPVVTPPNLTLTWSSVEGGTYSVDASAAANFSPFTNKASGLVASGISKASTYATLAANGIEYGRVNRTALATYDTNGQSAATVAQSSTTSYNAAGIPNTTPTISAIGPQSTSMNVATGAILFTVDDTIETPAANLTVTGSSANTTLVPNANIAFGGNGANRTVIITPASGQAGSASITVTVSDGTATASTTFTLTVVSTAPTISNIAIAPSTPSSADIVTVSATITPSSGRTISSAQLTYNNGSTSPTVVFNETMAAAAVAPWTGTNANYPWTVVPPVGAGGPAPPNPFSQTSAANHTSVGSGNQFGLEISGGPPLGALGDGSVTTTNNINATGTTATVEFYLAAVNQTATTGWRFQTSIDGTNWTTRLNESNVNRATHALFPYTLSAAERVGTLKLRFSAAGGGPGGTGIVRIDDVKVTVGATSTPVIVNMVNTGGNTWSAAIPAQLADAVVSYSISATDSATVSANSATNSYTVIAAAPILAVTPATGLNSSGNPGGPFSPSSAIYTLTNTGNAAMNWTAAKTAAWLTLSSPSGTLAAGANTTVTASVNSAANSLVSGIYNDTVTFTNVTNSNGNASRAVNLTVNYTSPPTAPVFPALTPFSFGSTKPLSWPAAAGATSYTLQISTSSDFSIILSSQTVTNPAATFSNLASGVTYYYRVLASNNVGPSGYSNVVSSTQDSGAPSVAISSPASATTTATNTIVVSGTSSDPVSGISKVTVNGVTATTANAFANWTITVPLGFGTNGITAIAYDVAGNVATTAPVRVTLTTAQTYNPLVIPEVITGTTFNLNLHTTTKQFYAGASTNTYAYNNMLFWGPTLIMNKGDWVQMNVTNNLADTTTTHWHGFHIPAIMDGGPHQVIPAGTTWSPSFKVDNNAGTYWYHPHLHEFTQTQLTFGAGGMIIIRDPEEAALNLPRTYGVDDIPLALTSRRFTANQFVGVGSEYGDVMVVNGVLNPQVSLPKQYVRLRLLNAEMERSYNVGVTTSAGADRTFYVIATDGGLVNAPIAVTRATIAVGERIEILLDLTGDTVGASFDVKAYNSGQANDFPGGEPATTGRFGSLLNNTTFNLLHVNVAAATSNPVTTRPAALKTNAFWTEGQATNSRTLALTDGFPGTGLPFSFDHLVYSPTVINQTLNLNAIEKWTLTNTSGFSHSFHIHDIQFNLISRTGGNNAGLKAHEAGWKDTLFIGQNQSVSFIAKFDGFASNTNPFMYHCHFSSHEDEGLMGQFVVRNNVVEDLAIASFTRFGNNNLIQLDFKATPGTTYSLQWSPDLGSWTTVGSVTSDGTSATFTETDPTRLSGPKGFYRVKVPTITSP